MKKSIIFLSTIVAVCLVLFILVWGLDNSKNDKDTIIKYLEEEDFVYDEDGGYYKRNYSGNTLSEYYSDVDKKKNSEFEELYFHLGLTRINEEHAKDVLEEKKKLKENQNLTDDEIYKKYKDEIYENYYVMDKVKMNYEDEVDRNYTGNYNLTDEVIKYKYEVTMYSSSIIGSGSYDGFNSDDFTCDGVSDRDMDEDEIDVFCLRAKHETLLFLEQAKDIIDNHEVSSIISN